MSRFCLAVLLVLTPEQTSKQRRRRPDFEPRPTEARGRKKRSFRLKQDRSGPQSDSACIVTESTMQLSLVRCTKLALLVSLVALLLLPGCRACLPMSDAERAAKEREEVHRQLNSSLLVLPYRGMKTVVRASAVTPPPAQIAEVIKIHNELNEKLSVDQTDFSGQSEQFLNLVTALYRSGSILYKEEEDRYPLLWNVVKAGPLPRSYYGAEVEHLFVGVLDLVLYATAKQKPLIDWVYYEFDRAAAQPSWPVELRALSQLLRGLMFGMGDKHYAAEEELTGYLDSLNKMSAQDRASLYSTQANGVVIGGDQVHKGMLGLGHLGRSFNRFALKRDDAAYADLEAALGILHQLGIDNELTDWGRISLALHKKDYAQADQALEHLASSPFLFEEDREEVKKCAASLSKLDKGFVLFGRTRAQFVVARAVFARLGGVKTLVAVLAILIGPENAARLARPTLLLWGVGSVLAEDVERKGNAAYDQGKQLGQKGVDFLRDKVDKLRD